MAKSWAPTCAQNGAAPVGTALVDQIESVVEPTRRREIPLKLLSYSKNRPANWPRMIHHTNQLVIPVTTIEDRAEAATQRAWLAAAAAVAKGF